MDKIKIKDKSFVPYISRQEIAENIAIVAEQMNKDLKDKNPIFLGVLNGSFMFVGDLMKLVNVECEITFIRLKSYSGTETTGNVKEVLGLSENLENRTVVILEDIIDTGHTMKNLLEKISLSNPAEVKIATLLFKPDALVEDIKPDYIVKSIPNAFILGYGLDYDGYGRNLADIYVVED